MDIRLENCTVTDLKGVNLFENTDAKAGVIAKIVFAFNSFTELLEQKYHMLKEDVRYLFFGKAFACEPVDLDIHYYAS